LADRRDGNGMPQHCAAGSGAMHACLIVSSVREFSQFKIDQMQNSQSDSVVDSDEIRQLEEDFANLARLVTEEAFDDSRMYLAKLVRKYRNKRPEFADKLNLTLRKAATRSAGSSILRRAEPAPVDEQELPKDADSRLSLIRIFDDRKGIAAPLLEQPLFKQIDAIVRERLQRERLAAHGIRPTRSAILIGPPGVGKTLSARWIAAKIGKPLWVLDLTTVMSSLLGKTGNNLRLVFDHARRHEAILLLDEIDAIAKRRSDESDVGELKRLVTAILQEVDAWPDSGLLLAATNHPELIDPALWRRFDAILTFSGSNALLVAEGIQRFMGEDFARLGTVAGLLAASMEGMSMSDVEREVMAIRRHAALEGRDPIHAVIEMALTRIDKMDRPGRQQLAIELAKANAMSHNKITEITGVSRDTIRKYAGPSPIRGRGKRKED
jgi:hypothetical protein